MLLFIVNYGSGYISEIANNFEISKSQVSKQLIRLELGGVLIQQFIGKTKVYSINPRLSIKNELQLLLEKSLLLMSKKEKKKFYRNRKRPRKTGKAL